MASPLLKRADDMTKKLIASLITSMALSCVCPSTLAQAAPGGVDLGSANTRLSVDAQSPSGSFVVTPPVPLSQEEKQDARKVAEYQGEKKTFDDYTSQAEREPLAVKLSDSVGHNRVAINLVWVLVAGFLVMFMQAGFALLETGLCRAKNAGHTMSMNFLIYPLGMLGFFACGFAFMFGGISDPINPNSHPLATLGGYGGLNHEMGFHIGGKFIGLLGRHGFMLHNVGYNFAALGLFLFQVMFLDTAATIPTGGVAERWKFSAFVVYGCVIGTFIYPVFGNWTWGGGWLANLGANFGIGHGHIDFAGSSVVHMQGGVIALVFAWLIGPRHGKYNKAGRVVHPIIPHSVPMVMLGTFILALGWFGFNAGSSLAGTDLRIAAVCVNTMLASATGALGATFWMWWVRTKKPDPSMMCNGMLAGLVAITCGCAFVSPGGACFIGLAAGILVVESVFFFDKIGIDDAVGAISVHGVSGAWGCLALGLFADGTYGDGWNAVAGPVKGLFYGGGFGQLEAEFIGVAVCFVTVSALALITYKVTEKMVGNRVSLETEIEGLDLPEMGVPGYTGMVMDKFGDTPMSSR